MEKHVDYIHTSLKILEEITKRSGGVKLREDNVLFMLAIRIKDLCNELGIFIESSTQLNGKLFAITYPFPSNQWGLGLVA